MPATPNIKLHGKYTAFDWTPTGGSTVALNGYSTGFKVSGKSQTIDGSTRANILAGARDKYANAPERTCQIQGLDSDENSPDWEALEEGTTGTIVWYRRGKTSGKPARTATAIVSGFDFDSPMDGFNKWTIDFELTSTITNSTVS